MRALDLSGDWVWLLDLTWPGPGATTRLSSRPVSVDNPAGAQWLYQGGIPALRVTTEAPFADVSVGMRTVSLAGVPLDHELVQRFPLAASAFELSYWKVGTPWKARVPVLTGTVKAATWGAEGQGVTLELAEQPIEDRALLLRQTCALARLRCGDQRRLRAHRVQLRLRCLHRQPQRGALCPIAVGAAGEGRGLRTHRARAVGGLLRGAGRASERSALVPGLGCKGICRLR